MKSESFHCSIPNCPNKWRGNKLYCSKHYQTMRRNGHPLLMQDRREPGSGTIDEFGYLRIYIDGKVIKEHRHIMELSLGRKLLKTESIHHVNGNKLDNRIENLELWITAQPRGQRQEDLIAYAHEILERYESKSC